MKGKVKKTLVAPKSRKQLPLKVNTGASPTK